MPRVRARRPDDLRDHVAGALDDHVVALANLLAVDVLLVVQRRRETVTPPTSTGSSSAHGLSAPVRPTRIDLQELRLRRHRRPLEGARPPRPRVEDAEPALLLELVDLDHDPVDLVVELHAPASQSRSAPRPPRPTRAARRTGSCGSRAPQPRERLRCDPSSSPRARRRRRPTPRRPRRCDRRVLLPERARPALRGFGAASCFVPTSRSFSSRKPDTACRPRRAPPRAPGVVAEHPQRESRSSAG